MTLVAEQKADLGVANFVCEVAQLLIRHNDDCRRCVSVRSALVLGG